MWRATLGSYHHHRRDRSAGRTRRVMAALWGVTRTMQASASRLLFHNFDFCRTYAMFHKSLFGGTSYAPRTARSAAHAAYHDLLRSLMDAAITEIPRRPAPVERSGKTYWYEKPPRRKRGPEILYWRGQSRVRDRIARLHELKATRPTGAHTGRASSASSGRRLHASGRRLRQPDGSFEKPGLFRSAQRLWHHCLPPL